MIQYHSVTKIYPPNTVAVENISFTVNPGEFVSLIGKSGAGKTTLLRMLLGEEYPTEGQVLFEQQDVHAIAASHLPELRRNIGVVFQEYRLLDAKTVHENVSYVMEVMGIEEDVIKRDVAEVLNLVNLQDKAAQFPSQLSGGEQQRVAIARALIHRPQVIVADEPTGNLDPYHTRDIIRLFVRINELGTTVLLATHNKDAINRLGKRVITLEGGRMVRDEQKGRFVI